MKLFINAVNVNHGGGKALLSALLQSNGDEIEIVALLDRRLDLHSPLSSRIKVIRVNPNVVGRFRAERWLKRAVRRDDEVLCFGNLPPLFPLACRVSVFIQNRYLIDGTSLAGLPLRVRLRLAILRIWLTMTSQHADRFIVQTPAMRTALSQRRFVHGKPILMHPFVRQGIKFFRSAPDHEAGKDRVGGFVYVASSEPHKNHKNLIEAWRLLAEDGLYPVLHLTVGQGGLSLWIEEQKSRFGLNLVNHGPLTPDQVETLYRQVSALIYPSTTESFGLPLIEARNAGLPILASELDYVRDVIDPEESFDPASPVSIKRAVKRFLRVDEPPLKIMTAEQFLAGVMDPAQ